MLLLLTVVSSDKLVGKWKPRETSSCTLNRIDLKTATTTTVPKRITTQVNC